MRTTLEIADDGLFAARELARIEKKTTGLVLSELARRSLQTRFAESCDTEDDEFFGFKPLPARGVVVTSELIHRLLEEEGP